MDELVYETALQGRVHARLHGPARMEAGARRADAEGSPPPPGGAHARRTAHTSVLWQAGRGFVAAVQEVSVLLWPLRFPLWPSPGSL